MTSTTSTKQRSKLPVVDIHTHMYPPSYIALLESRTTIPYIRTFAPSPTPRLIILPTEESTSSTAHGRPVGPSYSSISAKLAFMNTHHIDISILSLANPWLDFLPASTAGPTAASLNLDFEALCAQHPGRFYFFGTLPLSAEPPAILSEITHLSSPSLPHCRGIIMGTSGLGAGLDDPRLLPIFAALAAAQLPVFLHPHYGLPESVWGPRAAEYGHVLPLALGFPMETTIAVTRMYLAGVFEEVPELRVILAHSGGTLPFLAGRIQSCVEHDAFLVGREQEGKKRRLTVWEVLKRNIYLDAVVYSKVGLRAAIEASGADRVMFGTDHPFFPPLGGEEMWASVETNVLAVKECLGDGTEGAEEAMGGNAVRILRLGE